MNNKGNKIHNKKEIVEYQQGLQQQGQQGETKTSVNRKQRQLQTRKGSLFVKKYNAH